MSKEALDLQVAVAVEAVIHNALFTSLEMIAEKHGVIVEKIRIKWDPADNVAGFSIRRIDITSFTTHKAEEPKL